MAQAPVKEGLEDIIALQSTICFIDGQEGRLLYQGYDIADLVENSNFEETTYLLWHGELPTAEELERHNTFLEQNRALPDAILEHLKLIPESAAPMEVLRSGVSLLSAHDSDATSDDPLVRQQVAARLTARMPTIVAAYHRIRQGQEPVAPRSDLSLAANFLYMLSGTEPDPLFVQAFDAALIMHADHELNASTFAARVTTGTLSDMYSAITAAIGALKGPLHGGANEQVMRMLIEIDEVENAEPWLRERLDQKEKIMGFGHRVYKTDDPRAVILKKFSHDLGKTCGQTKWFDISRRLEDVMIAEKGIYPNVDFYSASSYHCMGIPTDLYTPIFACSRVSGWTAHILEQYANNRLIRPRAQYTGPALRTYVPMDRR